MRYNNYIPYLLMIRDNPEEAVKVGETIEVKILRVDPAERKIGLSRTRTGGKK